ncbi:hypothetical protein HDV00_008856 [Rhizophlyctis rosea]|nr:hypothetical protein HDV00_008856 [Rhizophlyctis rosea]
MGVCQSTESAGPVKAKVPTSPAVSTTSKPSTPQLASSTLPTGRPRADSFKFDTAGRRLHVDFTPLSVTAVASDKLYILPNDDEEMDRLHLQHYIMQLLFKGNFSSPVKQLLSQPGRKVLDLGCGSGIWAFETATAFPTCHVTGFDLSPVQPSTVKPQNVDFMVGDLTKLPLPFPDASFDFVDMRFLIFAFRADFWPTIIQEIVRVVKPGGYVEFLEPYGDLSGETRVPNFFGMMIDGQVARGIDIRISHKLKEYLNSVPLLTDVHEITKPIHMRPDPTDPESVRLAKMMSDDMISVVSGLKAVFLAKGVCDDGDFDMLVREHVKELAERDRIYYFTRCFARKRSEEVRKEL